MAPAESRNPRVKCKKKITPIDLIMASNQSPKDWVAFEQRLAARIGDTADWCLYVHRWVGWASMGWMDIDGLDGHRWDGWASMGCIHGLDGY